MTAVDITVLSLLGVLLLFVIVLPFIAESPRVTEKARDYIIGLSDKAAKTSSTSPQLPRQAANTLDKLRTLHKKAPQNAELFRKS